MSDGLVLVHNTLPNPMIEGKSTTMRIVKKYNERNHIMALGGLCCCCVSCIKKLSPLFWKEKVGATLGLVSTAKDSWVGLV